MNQNLQDLMASFQLLSQSVDKLSTQRSINQAIEQVNQIKDSEMEVNEQRAQIRRVANGLALQLVSLGTPASTIEQTMAAMMPQEQKISEDELLRLKFAQDERMLAMKGKQDERLQMIKGSQAERIASMRASQQKQVVSQGDKDFAVNARVALEEASKLRTVVKNFGNMETILGDQKAKAKLESTAYQLAINYAKIFDPASVAREGEVAAAQKYMIPMGLFTTNKQTLEAIKLYEDRIKEYVKGRSAVKANVSLGLPPEAGIDAGMDQQNDDIMKFLE